MFYLLLTVSVSASTVFTMRYSEAHSGNRYGVTLINYITGVIISFFLLNEKNVLFYNTPSGWLALGLGIVNAIVLLAGLLILQYSIKANGAPLTSTFNKIGVLLPTVFSVFLFREIPTILQASGIALAFSAIVYINGEKSESSKPASFIGLLAAFLIGGAIDMVSKIYGVYGDPELQALYVLYSFLFAALMSLGLFIKMNPQMTQKDFIAGFLVGIPNQLRQFFMLKSLTLLPAYFVLSFYSAGVILIVNIITLLVFKEKLSKRQYIGTGIIGISLFLINI